MLLKAIHSPNACLVRPDSHALWRGRSAARFVRENVDGGVYDDPDVAGPDCCGSLCVDDGVRQAAQFAVGGRPEDGGPAVVLHVEAVRTPGNVRGGTTNGGVAPLNA